MARHRKNTDVDRILVERNFLKEQAQKNPRIGKIYFYTGKTTVIHELMPQRAIS